MTHVNAPHPEHMRWPYTNRAYVGRVSSVERTASASAEIW
jgi:hypothetical protein